jgi:quercetin dioxygenase-like cupin family protein
VSVLAEADRAGRDSDNVCGGPVGAPTFAMRHFTVQPGGHTPLHKHDWEHEVYVLEGEGFVRHQDQEYPIRPGDAIFVPPNQLHQFRSAGSSHLRFLCMVPP